MIGTGHDVRALATARAAGEVLRRAVPALREGRWSLESVQPRRYEVNGTLALEGAADVVSERGVPHRLAFRLDEHDASFLRGSPFAGRDDVSGVAAGLSPGDARWPGLAALLEAPGVPDDEGRCEFRLLAHRFSRRITLRARDASGASVVVKRMSPKSSFRLAETHRRIGPAAADVDVRVARVLGTSPGRVVLEFLPGVPLHAQLDVTEIGSFRALGAGLRALAEAADATDLRAWTAEDEMESVRRFAERTRRLDPSRADAILRAAERVRIPTSGRTGLLHRDLHDKQVLSGETSILDWDLAAAGPIAIDAGNFLAHLELRSRQGRWSRAAAAAAGDAFVDGWSRDGEDAEEARGWAKVARLRLAGVYALRPGTGDLPERLLEELR